MGRLRRFHPPLRDGRLRGLFLFVNLTRGYVQRQEWAASRVVTWGDVTPPWWNGFVGTIFVLFEKLLFSAREGLTDNEFRSLGGGEFRLLSSYLC